MTKRLALILALLAVTGTAAAMEQTPDAEYLLTSAASDFRAHQPPTAIDFRRVHLASIEGSDGTPQPMLCGEFLASEGSGAPSWQPFVTVRTTKYEQWLGAQASALCARTSDPSHGPDLSAELKARLRKPG
ncbi:hypothetical protein [Luteibacter sp. 3190]|uniref:hypothetical protein n=1 Tax=Luteibacter sp. 3190 TaxID=2817736 RepID=UPI002859DCA3|nr:hypothetical protein [Luteibacter sp. 3190]MDR6936469.1 hypothetical protein [Luteibacter sp. 3190]